MLSAIRICQLHATAAQQYPPTVTVHASGGLCAASQALLRLQTCG